jgi:hypothetical protein
LTVIPSVTGVDLLQVNLGARCYSMLLHAG